MPINSFLYPGAKVTSAYEVANSCRFNRGDSPYLHKTPGSAGNRRTFTFSTWVKKSNTTDKQHIFGVEGGNSDTTWCRLLFSGSETLNFEMYLDEVNTTRVFRDPSAWLNIVLAVDTTQGTASNRVKIYINGVQETSFSSSTYPDEDQDLGINNTVAHNIGRAGADVHNFDGYMAETVFIDGLQLTPSSFGEFDEDSPTIWKPIDVSGLTFGTNGFYLDFEDSANLGNDANGGTDLTEVNLAATDQTTDTPTNNFCTFNNIATTNSVGDDLTFSEGNCKITNTASGAWHPAIGNIGVTSGKWYAEFKVSTIGGASKYGIIDVTQYLDNVNFASTGRAYSYEYYSGDAYNAGNYDADYGDSFTTDDIISVAMDLDNMKLYFAKNGTWQDSGDPTSGATGTGTHAYFGGGSNSANAAGVDTYAFAANIHNNSVTEANFGGCPAFTISF